MFGVLPDYAKRELLSALPAIIDDSCHARLCDTLTAELRANAELAVPILGLRVCAGDWC